MNRLSEFLSDPAAFAAFRAAILEMQAELAPEEVEATKTYLEPLIRLAARGELPSVDPESRSGQFGEGDWLLLPILSAAAGTLQSRLAGGAPRETWPQVTDAEVRPLVFQTKSPRGALQVPQLTRALHRAFARHLIDPQGAKGRKETRHTDISCPAKVWKSEPRFNLVVRLTVEQNPASVAALALELQPETSEVVVDLQAPGFEPLNGSRQKVTWQPGVDSTPAVFDLRPKETGARSLILDFFQGGQSLGAIAVPIEVTEQPASAERTSVAAARFTVGSSVPPPDRILRISWDRGQPELRISLLQAGGSSWEDFAPVPMNDPASYADLQLAKIPQLDTEADDRQRAGEELLKRIGQNLWRKLPEAFRELYAQEREQWRDSTLLLYTDEPNLPWEMLWPYGPGWEDEEPWCLSLALSRWLRRDEQGGCNQGAKETLPLASLACFAPGGSNLQAVSEEQGFLRELLPHFGIRDVSPAKADGSAMMDLLRSQDYDWLHFSGHGSFKTARPERADISLENFQTLTPEHLVGREIEDHLRQARPAFFFNACQSAQTGWGLTGVEGWAARLISCGAGMFLGPLALVRDSTALLMAKSIYEALLLNDATIADAARQARRKAREGGDPAWMSYCLYGHPNAKIGPRRPDEPINRASSLLR